MSRKPQVVGMTIGTALLKFSDGSSKQLVMLHNDPDAGDAMAMFYDHHPDNQSYKVELSPEFATWACQQLTCAVMGMITTMHRDGEIIAW